MPKNSSLFGFGVHCALHWILVFFKISIWFWAFVKTIMDFQIWYSMWFFLFFLFSSLVAMKALFVLLVIHSIGLIRVLITGM